MFIKNTGALATACLSVARAACPGDEELACEVAATLYLLMTHQDGRKWNMPYLSVRAKWLRKTLGRRRRHQPWPQVEGEDGEEGQPWEPPDPCQRPPEELAGLREEVERALDKLDDRERRIVRLITDGFTQREIGKLMGLSATTVCRILADVRDRLS